MRTAHAPHRHHARTVDVHPRRRRAAITGPGLAGGILGAFLGLFAGYAAGVAVMWFLHGRTTNGVIPPYTLWEALTNPGDFLLYTPLTIPLGFLLGGYIGEKIGRQVGRRLARREP